MDFFSVDFLMFFILVLGFSLPLRSHPLVYSVYLLFVSYLFALSWGLLSFATPVLLGALILFFSLFGRFSKPAAMISFTALLVLGRMGRTRLAYGALGNDNAIFAVGLPYMALQFYSLVQELPLPLTARTFVRLPLYIAYFPKLLVGPVERWRKIAPVFTPLDKETIVSGCYIIALALFKKLVISSRLLICLRAGQSSGEPLNFGDGWLFSFLFYFLEYCDFSAYLGVASGLSILLGVPLSPSFRTPYLATSPSDHWQRWNITFVQWIRDFIFFPVLGRTRNTYVATAAAFCFVALWLGGGYWSVKFAVIYCLLMWGESLWRSSRYTSFSPPKALAIFLQFQVSGAVIFFTSGSYFNFPFKYRFGIEGLRALWAAARGELISALAAILFMAWLETREPETRWPLLSRGSMALFLCFLVAALFRFQSYLFYYI